MFSFQGTQSFKRNSMKLLFRATSVNLFWMVESTGIEPVTSCLQGRRSPSWANPPFRGFKKWWARTRFSAEKPRRLQQSTGLLSSAAFRVHFGFACLYFPEFCQLDSFLWLFKKWWAKMDSNHRPHDYQSCALASWAIGPYLASTSF